MIELRPYQTAPARAILRSVKLGLGLTFTVEMARQAGKNELSAQLETLLLTMNAGKGGSGVKASPTFRPQTINSLQRLQDRMQDAGLALFSSTEHGYILTMGRAKWLFFSASETANVVGATASLLLEGDEAQDIDADKWRKDFRPMGATTNVTTVLYGTAWDSDNLLEVTKQQNLELERRDGTQRHFEYDWHQVALHNPAYAAYVAAERDALGEEHPLFQTQYLLRPLNSLGRLFSPAQLTLMRSAHQSTGLRGHGNYVAGIDVAGASEQDTERSAMLQAPSARDSTVMTVARVEAGHAYVVKSYEWTNLPHHQAIDQLKALIEHWNCRQVVIDATGMGEPVASMLYKAFPRRVTPFVFTAPAKSELGYALLAAVNRRSLHLPTDHPAAAWRQLELARIQVRPNRTMTFYVEASDGHDDHLMSLALTQHAADLVTPPRIARGG